MTPSHRLLLALLTLATAGAVLPLAVFGLLAFLLYPWALFLTACAIHFPADDASHQAGSVWRTWSGIALLAAASWIAGSLAFAGLRPHLTHPPASAKVWVIGMGCSLLGAALFSSGVKTLPQHEQIPTVGWFAAAAGVFPLAFLLMRLLAHWLPISA